MGLLEKDHFALGFFGINCSGALAATKVPERWNSSWSNNVTIVKMAEDAGIDFVLPLARWVGYGGETDFEGNSLETFTWAAGLAALTKRIKLVVTAHTRVHSPVVAAKQLATIDQISNSRVVLNIVAGWNKAEFDALGLDLPASHEERYTYAEEWCKIIRTLWTKTERFDYDGKYWKLKNVLSDPRPPTHPTIMNAAGSGEGKDFATRNADVLFTVIFDLEKVKKEIAELKAKAREAGREVEVLTTSYVVCRPTEQEAKDYVHYYVDENADWAAAEKLRDEMIAGAKTFPEEVQDSMRYNFAAGHGTWAIVGDPSQVAKKIVDLHEAGLAGTTISFVNFIEEFPYFRDNVLPLLEKAGIRKQL